MDAVEDPVRISTRSSLSVENKQAHAGRHCRTCLARSNPQTQTRTGGKCFISLYVQLCGRRFRLIGSGDHTTSRIGNHTPGVVTQSAMHDDHTTRRSRRVLIFL